MTTTQSLCQPLSAGPLSLGNRIAMAPMTRSRAPGNVPNAVMREYYRQRNGAGMVITEGTASSPEGLGYARIPGLFNAEQAAAADALRATVEAVRFAVTLLSVLGLIAVGYRLSKRRRDSREADDGGGDEANR